MCGCRCANAAEEGWQAGPADESSRRQACRRRRGRPGEATFLKIIKVLYGFDRGFTRWRNAVPVAKVPRAQAPTPLNRRVHGLCRPWQPQLKYSSPTQHMLIARAPHGYSADSTSLYAKTLQVRLSRVRHTAAASQMSKSSRSRGLSEKTRARFEQSRHVAGLLLWLL